MYIRAATRGADARLHFISLKLKRTAAAAAAAVNTIMKNDFLYYYYYYRCYVREPNIILVYPHTRIHARHIRTNTYLYNTDTHASIYTYVCTHRYTRV